MSWNYNKVKIKATIEAEVPEGDYCKKEMATACGCCEDESMEFEPCSLIDCDTYAIWGGPTSSAYIRKGSICLPKSVSLQSRRAIR